jgi:arylsulfatase A-like enzyme
MRDRPETRTASVVKAAIFAAIVYSLFEGLFYYREFPVYNPVGTLRIFLRNLLLFPAAGLAVQAALGLLYRLVGWRDAAIDGPVRAAVLLLPVYFFIFALLEGTGFIYQFLDSPMQIAALVAMPILLLFFPLAGGLRRGGGARYVAFVVTVFFFVNAGHQFISMGALIRLDPRSVAAFAGIVVAHVVIFLLSARAAPIWLDGEGRFRAARLLILLAAAAALAVGRSIPATRVDPAGEEARAGRPNVLLVVLDTARMDRFSCYGYDRSTTPFLESFGAGSTVYTRARTPAPWTMPSHASIFTGLYPSAHGLTWKNLFLDDRHLTLAELFAANGYTTIGVCNNAWVNLDNGLAQGFGTYLEMWRQNVLNPTFYHRLEWFVRRFLGKNDHGALRSSQWIVDWLDHRRPADRPFFMFLNLMECHLSDDAPDAYHERFLRKDYSRRVKTVYGGDLCAVLTGRITLSDAEWQDFGDIYDGDLYYIDRILESLVGELERRGLLDETIVVITADHGEHLGEHRMIDHQLSLYEPLLRVPLIIRVPEGLPEPGRAGELVQTVDLYPTLVDLAGLEGLPEGRVQGESLAGTGGGRGFAISEYEIPEVWIRNFLAEYPEETGILKYRRSLKSVTVDSLKFIRSSNGDSELYDLATDPGENENIRDLRPDRAAELEALLTGWLGSFEAARPERMRGELDPETRQRLKALGYID